MAQQWMRSQDTFVAALADGSEQFVAKGDLLPASHELVIRDQKGSGKLFRPLDLDDAEAGEKPAARLGAGKAS